MPNNDTVICYAGLTQNESLQIPLALNHLTSTPESKGMANYDFGLINKLEAKRQFSMHELPGCQWQSGFKNLVMAGSLRCKGTKEQNLKENKKIIKYDE